MKVYGDIKLPDAGLPWHEDCKVCMSLKADGEWGILVFLQEVARHFNTVHDEQIVQGPAPA